MLGKSLTTIKRADAYLTRTLRKDKIRVLHKNTSSDGCSIYYQTIIGQIRLSDHKNKTSTNRCICSIIIPIEKSKVKQISKILKKKMI